MKRSLRKFRHTSKFYRINFFIQAPTLRLLDETGKQIGIVSKLEALKLAQEQGIDVVEIAPNAKPPVAKLIEFKKFKYLINKKAREERKGQKSGDIKEIRLGPFMSDHDLQIRAKKGQEFLKAGHQIKVSVPFKGRQITRKEFGFNVLNRFLQNLQIMKVVRPAHFEGRVLTAVIAPDKGLKLVS